MTFEFFTPEGVSVRCETIEELVESYTALWRNQEHTAIKPLPEGTLQAIDFPARSLNTLPALESVWEKSSEEVENPTIMMPKSWAEIWLDVLKFGFNGTSVASTALRIRRNKNTVWTTTGLMQASGFIEKSEIRGLWRVPVQYRHHKLVISRVIAVKG